MLAAKVLPLLKSSSGLAFAAFLPPEILDPIVQKTLEDDGAELARFGIGSRADVDLLLQGIRDAGIATAVGMVVPAIASLSAPIFDRTNTVVAVLTIVGITGMISIDEDGDIARLLRQRAGQLSAMLGASRV